MIPSLVPGILAMMLSSWKAPREVLAVKLSSSTSTPICLRRAWMKSTAFLCPGVPGLRDPMATKSFTYVHARWGLIVAAGAGLAESAGAGEVAAGAATDGDAASAGRELEQPISRKSAATRTIVRDIRAMIRQASRLMPFF